MQFCLASLKNSYSLFKRLTGFEYIYFLLSIFNISSFYLIELGASKVVAYILLVIIQFYLLKKYFLLRKKNPFSHNLKYMYWFILSLTIICILIQGEIRGVPSWTNTTNYFTSHFLYGQFMGYLIPFCLLINLKGVKFNLIIKSNFYFFVLAALYFIILQINHNIYDYNPSSLDNESYNFYLLRDIAKITSFTLLLYPLLKNKKYWYYSLAIHLFALYYLIYFGRRTASLELLLYILAGLYFMISKLSGLRRIVYSFIIATTLISCYIAIINNDYSHIVKERILLNNRSESDLYFIRDMFNSPDIIWGRGLNGRYHHPGYARFYSDSNTILKEDYRYAVETGYFQMILNGGLIYTMLYVSILFYCAYLGFFKSRNDLTKMFAIYIFIYLILLRGGFAPSYTVHDYIMWFGALISSKYKYRKMSNRIICNRFSI